MDYIWAHLKTTYGVPEQRRRQCLDCARSRDLLLWGGHPAGAMRCAGDSLLQSGHSAGAALCAGGLLLQSGRSSGA
eukprot:8133952-Alexandrium_andersonii.AAC.1